MKNRVEHMSRIPISLEEITAEWLTEVLASKYPGVVVTAAEVSDFVGHKRNKARVAVRYNAAGKEAGLPDSLFFKGSLKAFNEASTTGLDGGLDIANEIEVMSYIELLPVLDVNAPKVYAALFDATSYSGIVVMEDLALSGATFMKQSPSARSLTYAQAVTFIDALARMHAPWFHNRALEAGGIFGPDSGLAKRTRLLHKGFFDHMANTPLWHTFVAAPRGEAVPGILLDEKRCATAQRKMHEIHQTCPRIIIHGDEHIGNLYVDVQGQPGFVDWTSRIEPWPISVSYFLAINLDTLDRSKWERALLSLYLDRLTHYGAKAPSFEEAWFQYRCTMLYIFLVWFINSTKWQPEAINTRNTVRGAHAMIDHDVFGLLGV